MQSITEDIINLQTAYANLRTDVNARYKLNLTTVGSIGFSAMRARALRFWPHT